MSEQSWLIVTQDDANEFGIKLADTATEAAEFVDAHMRFVVYVAQVVSLSELYGRITADLKNK